MEIIGFILMAILVAVLLFTTFWFGVFLLSAIALAVLVELAIGKLTGKWRRFGFVRHARPEQSSKVIEGEYKDITHQ